MIGPSRKIAMPKMKHLLLIAVVLLLPSCSVNPVTGEHELAWMDEAWEINTGKKYYSLNQQASGGKYVIDPDLTLYVSSIGKRLAAQSDRLHLPYEFVVLNDSTPNAWALPGGKIAINRGLLVELGDEAELAAVLAHEIVHAAARHSAQSQEMGTLVQLGTLAAGGLLSNSGANSKMVQQGIAYSGLYGQQRYSRSRETEADLYGMRYMAQAGYDPMAAVDLQKTFVRLSEGRNDLFNLLFASHPPSPQRVAANIKTAATLPSGGNRGVQRFNSEMQKLRKRQPAYELSMQAQKALTEENYLEAIALTDKAIAIESKESEFHEVKGFALAKLNRSRDALTAYNKAVNLNPGYYAPVLRRGLLRYELKSMQAAEQDLKTSIRLAPTAIAYTRLGEVEESRGDCRQAMSYYQQAMQYSANNGEQLRQKLLALKKSCAQ